MDRLQKLLNSAKAASTCHWILSATILYFNLGLSIVSNYFTFQSWFEYCEQLCGFNLGSVDQSFTSGENVLLPHKSLQQRERTHNNNDNNDNNIPSPRLELCQCCCWIEIYSYSYLKTSFGFQCLFQMATRSLILWLTSSTRLKRMQTTHWVQQKVPQREFLNPNKCTTIMWVSQKRCWQNFEGNVGRPDFWAKVAQSGLIQNSVNNFFWESLYIRSLAIVWCTEFTHLIFSLQDRHHNGVWRREALDPCRSRSNRVNNLILFFLRNLEEL